MNTFTFHRQNNNSKIGVNIVKAYLALNGGFTFDMQDDEEFQAEDVDLLYIPPKKDCPLKIEVKVDNYRSGNFFFEVMSNVELEKEGCFMYTKAHYIFYYFISWDRLYILPTHIARKWFIENAENYEDKELRTKVGKDSYYHSIGKAVPIKHVLKGIKRYWVVENVSELII